MCPVGRCGEGVTGRLCVVNELIANSASLRDKRSDALLELTFYLFSFLGLAAGEIISFSMGSELWGGKLLHHHHHHPRSEVSGVLHAGTPGFLRAPCLIP